MKVLKPFFKLKLFFKNTLKQSLTFKKKKKKKVILYSLLSPSDSKWYKPFLSSKTDKSDALRPIIQSCIQMKIL